MQKTFYEHYRPEAIDFWVWKGFLLSVVTVSMEEQRSLEISLKTHVLSSIFLCQHCSSHHYFRGSLEELKCTRGEALPGWWGWPVEKPWPAQLCGHSPVLSEASQGSSLSRTSWTTQIHLLSASLGPQQQLFQLNDINLHRTTPAGRGSGLCSETTGPSFSQQSKISNQHFLRDFCSKIRLSPHTDKMLSLFTFQHERTMLPTD